MDLKLSDPYVSESEAKNKRYFQCWTSLLQFWLKWIVLPNLASLDSVGPNDSGPVWVHVYSALDLVIFILCVWIHVCTCTTRVPGALRGQKRAVDPLQLKLQRPVSCHVGTRNHSYVLWKSSQCSCQLSHVSGPFVALKLVCTSLFPVRPEKSTGSQFPAMPGESMGLCSWPHQGRALVPDLFSVQLVNSICPDYKEFPEPKLKRQTGSFWEL